MRHPRTVTALFLTGFMLATLFLAACGSDRGNTGGGEEDGSGKKEIVEIDFWTIALSPNFNDYINGRIRKFESEHANIKVKWTDLPYNAIENKLLTSIAGDNAPDVVNLNTGMALTLAAKNALVDLNQEVTEQQRSIYFENMYKSASIGTSAYAFPWYLTMGVLMYNKQIYEAAGLDPDQPPKTWDDVVRHAKQIKAKTGKYGFVYTPNVLASLTEQGVPILNEDKTKVIVNTPEALRYAKWVKALYDEDVVPKDGLTGGYNYAVDQYQAGQLAMLTTGSQFLNRVKQNAPDVYRNTLVAQMPSWQEGGKIHTPLMNVVVPKLSKHHREAIAFAHFITNDESQLEFAKVVNILPSTKKAAEDPFFTQNGDDPEFKAKVITAKQLPRAYDFTLGLKRENDLVKAFNDEWTKMLLGQQTPEDALKTAEQNMQNVLDEINKQF